MTDILNNLPEEPIEPETEIEPEDDLDEGLDDLEQFQNSVPEGAYITIRHEAQRPVYVPLLGDETSISIADALNRRNVTVSPSIQAYVEGSVVPLTHLLPGGSVVTLVGNVKGG